MKDAMLEFPSTSRLGASKNPMMLTGKPSLKCHQSTTFFNEVI